MFSLPELPFPKDALVPHISTETLDYHYSKHHQKYVNNLNALTKDTEWASKSLDEIVKQAEGGIFNNGAQVWNHAFYWHCLNPKGGGEPGGSLADAIKRDFGSVSNFKDAFTKTAETLFGSGWTWLMQDADGKLSIGGTSNADNPLRSGKKPLLTCDVWEHAYYIDYRNARPSYIQAFWKIVNWDFVEKNLK